MTVFVIISLFWFALGGIAKLTYVVKDQYPRVSNSRGYDAGDAMLDLVMVVFGLFALFY